MRRSRRLGIGVIVGLKYIDAYKRTPSPGSRPVQIHVNAFPLVRGEATEDAPTPKGQR